MQLCNCYVSYDLCRWASHVAVTGNAITVTNSYKRHLTDYVNVHGTILTTAVDLTLQSFILASVWPIVHTTGIWKFQLFKSKLFSLNKDSVTGKR